MNFQIKLFCRLALLFVLSACSGKIDNLTLVGKYILNTGSGVDALELKPDGSYIHTYQDTAIPETTRTGQWELEDVEGAKTVTLHDFEPLPGERTNGRGFYLLRVRRSMGSVHLMTDADLNCYYQKQKQ